MKEADIGYQLVLLGFQIGIFPLYVVLSRFQLVVFLLNILQLILYGVQVGLQVLDRSFCTPCQNPDDLMIAGNVKNSLFRFLKFFWAILFCFFRF